mmetsp:Transcript_4667/g.5335  ORF Transcript_4667/g.5335 Transcript_4667/m.5335 type:complete len:326 (-) Transcript_4667:451-1428(-)
MQEEAPRHSAYENYLRDMWVNDYNKDFALLSCDYFNDTDQSDLQTQRICGNDDKLVLLFGVVIELLLATGVLYDYALSNELDPHDACWKWVKCALDKVWQKYHQSNTSHSYDQSWEGLSSLYTGMISRLRDDSFLLFRFHEKWIHQYNKNHTLLHPDDFDDYALAANLPQRTSHFGIEDELEKLIPSTVQPLNPKLKTWTAEEEIILVGAVIDYFLSRGLLSSAQKTGNGGSDCWDMIRRQFDLACSNAIRKNLLVVPAYYSTRTPRSLYSHYKWMRGARGHAERLKTKIKCGKLVYYYDKWMVLNKDGALLAQSESLCAANANS